MIASASATFRLLVCQWWARPDVAEQPREEADALTLGMETHEKIEGALLGLPGESTPLLSVWRAWWQMKPFGDDIKVHVERPLVYDAAADAASWSNVKGRAYDPRPGVISGRPDLVVEQGKRVLVVDWKTGEDHAGYTAESAPAQLRTYAVAASRIFGIDEVTIVVVHVREDGVTTEAEALDVFDLDAHSARLKSALTGVESALPQPGGHCLRCPALAICPAHDTAALETAHELPLVTLQTAGPMLLAAKAAAKRIEQIERACEAMVRSSPEGVLMPDGGTLAIRVSPVERIKLDGPNGVEAEAILIRAGAGEAIERPAPKASKGAIEKLIGKAAAPVLDELRALGALGVSHETSRVVVTPPAGEVKPKRARPKRADVVIQGEARPAEGAIVVRAEVSADVAAPVVVPDPLADFIAATKAASTLDDLKALRATLASTTFPDTQHTTARAALRLADNRINRS